MNPTPTQPLLDNEQADLPQYNPLYKPNQLICGTGQVAVITGWTVKEIVAKKLSPSEYAVVGQLYSPTRGISFLIRNLLANPQVHHLVILDATKEDAAAGGCQCLHDFFTHGVEPGVTDTGRECWVIKSSVVGYIDKEIPLEAIELLRSSIWVYRVTTIASAINVTQVGASAAYSEHWREVSIFPEPDLPLPTVFPGDRYGHRIEGKTIAETWVKIIHRIKTTGTIRPTQYDGHWQELIDLTAVVTDEPEEFYFPEPNYLPCDRPFIQGYVAQILDDAPDQEGVKYTYGQRLRSWFGRDQIEQVIDKLSHDPDAASAVMSLWHVKDHDTGGSPCLNHIWVRIVDGELSLTATFRSNDMFSAWPANAMGLRTLQRHIRDAIANQSGMKLTMGPLVTMSQSAHIYDDCWENSDRLIDQQYSAILQRRDYSDPCGNFLIEVVKGTILVTRTTPGSGEIIKQYNGNNPLGLVRQICRDAPAIQPEHIGCLGIELHRALEAIKSNRQYTQDERCW